ncbi:MAG: ABC transporter permease subunit [Chloroflexota bacterium]
MDRILTIIDKEWAEVFKNRIVLFTIGFMPLIFTILPLAILFFSRNGDMQGADVADLPPSFRAACGNIAPADCLQIFLVNQFLILFMMMPLIIPVAIAAYSIVGEKTTRSLEPLLATPITTVELLAAKSLAAAIPAIVATWACFVIFIVAAPFVGAKPVVVASIFSPVWLVAVFVAGPLMAIMAVNFAVIVSSRVNDPRVAEQMAAVIIVPLLGMLFGQLAGVIVLNVQFMLAAVSIIWIIDVGLSYLGARLVQRETILTKWK